MRPLELLTADSDLIRPEDGSSYPNTPKGTFGFDKNRGLVLYQLQDDGWRFITILNAPFIAPAVERLRPEESAKLIERE